MNIFVDQVKNSAHGLLTESVVSTAESNPIKNFDSYVVPLPCCCLTNCVVFGSALHKQGI